MTDGPLLLPTLRQVSRDTLQDQVYRQIREALMSGRFQPGQKLTIPVAGTASLEGHWLVIEMVSRPIQGQTYSVTSHSQRSLFGAIGSM